MTWLKSKWQWIVVGLVALLAMLLSRNSDTKAIVALQRLKDLEAAHADAAAKASELEAKANKLATEFLSEQVQVEAAKEKMHHVPDSDVDTFLIEHGAVRPAGSQLPKTPAR